MDKPEVLVHISTPATRANDDLYRHLADAYLAFEPHQPSQSAEEGQAPSVTANPRAHGATSSQRSLRSDAAVAVLTSMDSYGSFPSHLDSGGPPSDQHHPQSYGEPSSQEDVSISRLERLERMQTKWKEQEQRTPRSSLANSRMRDNSNLTKLTGESSFIEDTQQAFQVIDSQLPDHMSTTSEESREDDSDAPTDEDVTLGATAVAGIEAIRSPFAPSSGNVRVELSYSNLEDKEQLSTQKSLDLTVPGKESQGPLSQQSATSVVSARRGPGHAQSPAQRIDFDSLPLTVCPPPPKITVMTPARLPSQVTPYLAELKRQNPGRFKLKATPREMELDERGHWRVDCRLWPKHVQQQFWAFLQKDVESGRLGWGVTLHRDAVRMRLGLVRLYCWGETIQHMWLALWLHSGGRVWSTGATWIDAEDIEVLKIP